MGVEKIVVVVVEDVEVARSALRWALHNILRCGDVVTLLHVYPRAKSRSKRKHLRLKGFQLALSFRDIICSCHHASFPNTEIVVAEANQNQDQDQDQGGGCREGVVGGVGERIAAVVREIGASTLVLGLHDRSFLYSCLAMTHNNVGRTLDCKVLAIKDPTKLSSRTILLQGRSNNMDFSQVEIAALSVPEVHLQKIPYQICPDPNAIVWRSKNI